MDGDIVLQDRSLLSRVLNRSQDIFEGGFGNNHASIASAGNVAALIGEPALIGPSGGRVTSALARNVTLRRSFAPATSVPRLQVTVLPFTCPGG